MQGARFRFWPQRGQSPLQSSLGRAWPGGQGEKHLFAHDILKRETALFIVTDFGLVGRDGTLAWVGVCGLRTEDEVEVAGELRGTGSTQRAQSSSKLPW